MTTGNCLLCKQINAEVKTTVSGVHVIQHIDCPWCGQWCMDVDVMFRKIRAASPQIQAALADHIRHANAAGVAWVELTPEICRDLAAADLESGQDDD